MRKLLTVSFLSGCLSVFRMASGFVLVKIVAMYTGTSGLALLGQVQGLVTAVNGLSSAPVNTGVIKYTAELANENDDRLYGYWKAAIFISSILCAMCFVTLIFFCREISVLIFGGQEHNDLIILLAICIPFVPIYIFVMSVVNGFGEYKKYIKLGFISTFITTVYMIIMIYTMSLKGALLAAVSGVAISSLVILVMACRESWFRICNLFGQSTLENKKQIGKYLSMAVSTALAMPLALIFIRSTIVGQYGWEEAGMWQAVWKVSEAYLTIITVSLSVYYLPKLASIPKSESISKEVHRTARVVLPIVVISATAIFYFRGNIISLLFTDEFSLAQDLFFYQLAGDIVKVFSWLYSYPMVSNGKASLFISFELGTAIVFSILSVLLIDYFGVEGVPIAYLITYIIYAIILVAKFKTVVKR